MLRHLARGWVVVVVLVALATGEWLHRPAWGWVAGVAVCVAALGVAFARAAREAPGRWRLGGLFVAGVALVGALVLAQSRLTRIEAHWPAEREARVVAAGRDLAGDLHAAFERAERLAQLGAEVGSGSDQAAALDALARVVPKSGPESGVAVLEPDGRPWAWAGRHRLPPLAEGDSITARATGYYVVLETRRHSADGRVVVASVLVWAHPVTLARSRSLAELFEARTGVRLAVYPAGAGPDNPDVFDYQEQTTAGPRLLFSAQPIPPEQGIAKQRVLVAGSEAVSWLLLLALVLALVASTRPLERYTLLPLALWLPVRAPVGAALHLRSLFAPLTFYQPLLGPLSASAGALALTGALVVVFGVWLRRRRPSRRWWTVVPALALVVGTPWLVATLGQGITPPARGVSAGLWLTWELALALAGAAPLVVAAALLHGRAPEGAAGRGGWERGRGRGWLAALGIALAVGAGILGLVGWRPGGAVPAWYLLLWGVAFLLVTLRARRAATLVAIAAAAGCAAALATWSAELTGRLQLAERDVAGLGTEADPFVPPLLERLADLAAKPSAGGAPEDASQLYAFWQASALARQGYPARLALWTDAGTRLADLPLDSLDVPRVDELVRGLAPGETRRILPVERAPGTHYLLLARVGRARVLSVLVGPRTELVPRGRLGQLLDPERRAPLYQLTLSAPDPGERVTASLEWRREDWQLRAERVLAMPGGPREVHAVIDLRAPFPIVVRGTLAVLLDVVLLAALWTLAELAAGARLRRPRWRGLARSFRVRLAVTLATFFILPLAAFALWGFARLADEAERGRDLLLMQTLRDAVASAGGLLAAPDVRVGEQLDALGRRLDADLALYSGGRLVTTSAPILEDLGVVSPLLDPRVYHSLAIDGDLEIARDGPNPELAERIGYRVVAPGPPTAPGILAAPQLTNQAGLAQTQLDLGLVLLLAVLAGAAAALVGAQAAARTLSRPVAELRRSALALGQGRPMPSPDHVPPLEFEPVFGAFGRMAADIAASRAALEQARRRTATVLATVATGVIGLDADGRVLIANRQARDLLDAPLEDGAPLLPLLDDGWTPLAEAVRHALADAGAGAEAPAGGGTTPLAAVEHDHAVELTVGPRRLVAQLASLGPDLRGVVVALNDVTDLSRAERVLAWGEMARQVAHEIKNPLTPMRLGMQHLLRVHRDRRPEFDHVLAETAERILGEIDRLDTIARAFSRFGAPTAEQAPLERVDLVAAASEVAKLYGLANEGAAVAVEVSPAADAVLARARRDEVKEVIVNLLENARNAGATRVAIGVRPGLVTVTDDGHGIAPELLPRIFEPRFSTTTSGSGLGLPIVRRLVESWGGAVTVASEVGRGTTVRVQVPE
ncbi:MAG TPA: ATP-binding protein [Gemmatimonadales bacterium]|nr:ATP-binding protein [Gemmatimonadales bacterium]